MNGHIRRPEKCLSDFVLDELVSGDLVGTDAERRARTHLADCERCSERLRAIESVEAPPLTAQVKARAKAQPRGSRLGRVLLWTLPAAAGIAAVVGLGQFRHPSESAEPNREGVTRFKGALTLGVVLKRSSGEVARLGPGATVSPGETLRFEVASARPGFVAVFGMDARGAVTPYAPFSGPMLRLEAGPPLTLPGSIETDDTLGAERIVALVCPNEKPVSDLATALTAALARAGGDPLRVQAQGLGCEQATFDIEKKPRP